MDDRRFDAWVRRFAGPHSRRQALRALVGGLGGELFGAAAHEAAAQSCRTSDNCPDCMTCQRRQGESTGRCVGGCKTGTVCCDGTCKVPGPRTCCTDSSQCGDERGCLWCDGGRCRPRPNGRECGNCKRCKEGACTEADPELLCDGVCCGEGKICTDDVCCPIARECSSLFGRTCCPEGERCTQEDGCCPQARACGNGPGARAAECCDDDEQCVDGRCCPVERACGDRCCPRNHRCRGRGDCCPECLEGGRCCERGSVCINAGFTTTNTCCNESVNEPCGANGDGTFAACCSNANEECCNGKCVEKGSCCKDGRKPCNGRCCAGDERCVDGRCTKPCTDGRPRCGDACCGANEYCEDGRCKAKCRTGTAGCCKDGRRECDGSCCSAGTECCDGACVNTRSDARNCGACGTRCRAYIDRCYKGTCRHFCTLNPENTIPCGPNGPDAFCCHPSDGCCGDYCCIN